MALKPADIAGDFLKAANDVVARKNKEAAEKERLRQQAERRQALQERRMAEGARKGEAALKKELVPLLDVLESLPPKDGKKFYVYKKECYGRPGGGFDISIELHFGLINHREWKNFGIENACSGTVRTNAKFARCRTEIGTWVAETAPDRVEELASILLKKNEKKQKPHPKRQLRP